MTYCSQCGTAATGAFCERCGAVILKSAPPPTAGGDVGPLVTPVIGSFGASYPNVAGSPNDSIVPPTGDRAPSSPRSKTLVSGHDRTMLAWETRLVMLAFLFPAIASAVIVFAAHTAGVVDVTRFPTFVPHNPVLNLILGVVSYLSVGAVVPLALFMLARTGQPPYMLGLGRPRFTKDLAPGLGLAVAAFAVEVFMIIPFATLIKDHPGLFNTVSVGHVPAYYVIWGIAISATTAVAEEVMMTGYFLTRLEQLGWSPNASLLVSLTLRTSYHVYYGLGFVLTIPLGYFVTKSYQKHHRLNRSIAAHFLYDAVLVTVSILR